MNWYNFKKTDWFGFSKSNWYGFRIFESSENIQIISFLKNYVYGTAAQTGGSAQYNDDIEITNIKTKYKPSIENGLTSDFNEGVDAGVKVKYIEITTGTTK